MHDLKKTARIAGLWYLGLAITGMLGFLLVRPAIHVPADATATLRNLIEHETLARLGVALELGIVLTQALAAVWFYKLLRSLNPVAAGATAAFGLVNAVAILISAAVMATAVAVPENLSLAPAGDNAGTVQLLFAVSGSLWSVGGIFFGLWLIPMGHVVVTSGRMPKMLGWTLIVGGVGYLLSAFLSNGIDDVPPSLVDALALPSAVGEFWMIGYLLFVGIRPAAEASATE